MHTEIFGCTARVEPAVVALIGADSNPTGQLVGYEVGESSEQLVKHEVARNRARVVVLMS
jgi:hypothetical protein